MLWTIPRMQRSKERRVFFWKEMEMRTAVDSAVADVEQRFEDGLIPWTWQAIRAEITPYPNKHCLDVLLPGQEDEATPDTCKYKWEEDGAASELGEEDDADEKIEDFCPEDWVVGAEAALTYGVAADKDAQHHGGGGTALGKSETLDEEVLDMTFEQTTRLRQLKEADAIFKELGGALGVSLRNTVSQVVNSENKRFVVLMKQDKRVCSELYEGMQAEEARYRLARVDYIEQMKLNRERTSLRQRH